MQRVWAARQQPAASCSTAPPAAAMARYVKHAPLDARCVAPPLAVVVAAAPTPSIGSSSRQRRTACGAAQYGTMYDTQPGAQASFMPRYYADFTVYKSKSAMSVSLVRPTWGATQGGNYRLVRQGALLLKFAGVLADAPSVAQSTGQARYNWSEAVPFALSPVEVGELLAREAGTGQRFVHDPFKQVPDREGTELKTLTVEPAPPGQQGRRDTAFRLRHKSAGGTAEVFIYVTPGEMKVLESIAQQALPMLAGFEVWPDGGNFDMSGGGGAGAGGGGQDMSLMG